MGLLKVIIIYIPFNDLTHQLWICEIYTCSISIDFNNNMKNIVEIIYSYHLTNEILEKSNEYLYT